MCLACRPGLLAFAKHGTARRGFLKGMIAAGALLAAKASAAEPAAAPAGSHADLIMHGGKILTMNDAQPQVEAIAVSGGKIIGVGSLTEIMTLKGPKTQVIELGSRTLLPGFVEPHIHSTFAFFDSWLDLGPFVNRSMDEVKAKVMTAVASAKPGDWILGQLFDPLITQGTFDVSIKALDALAPNNPLVILEDNGHIAFVNSKAFAAAGITTKTPDPPHGRFLRDAAGNFTGEIQEPPALIRFAEAAPKITGAQYVANILKLFNLAASKGCTSVHDCGIGALSPESDLAAIKAVMEGGAAPVRFSGFLASTAMPTWQAMGLKPDNSSETVRINGVKAWVDGTNQGYSGYQRVPYLNTTSVGTANYTLAALSAAVVEAHDNGWQVGVHANGDAAIDMALTAFEATLKKTPRKDARHRIEHCTLLHPEQMDKMVELGISPSFTIGHVYYWGDSFQKTIFGPERAKLIDLCASVVKKGMRLSLHSDYNVTPIGPLRYVSNAVTRNLRGTTQTLNPTEALTPMQALRAVTIDAAWQCHMDDIVGSLEVGKCADFVLLDRDPTKVPPAEIMDIPVHETWLGGMRRFSAKTGSPKDSVRSRAG
ncbi:twin-arginine translocation pathway signal protein [Beijerinckiaceae bacterium]|nr:twin-arginine translocation pathway signal protein [Beijerinckiaceae bacterium]